MSELTRRTKIVKEISKLIRFDCSLGVTGSTANGVPNKNSDIDLFVVIDSEKINELVRIIYNLNTFQLPSSKVLSGFKNGAIDVIFLYGEIDDIQVNFEIYSLKSVEKLLKLLPITITRFRTRPTADSLFFSSSSGKFIPVTMKKQPFAEGFLSSLPGSIKRRKITYIGNHLRKLLFSKMYKDKKYIGKLMNECFSYFVRDALSKNKFSDLMFVNLSVFDKEKKMSKYAIDFYRSLCKNMAEEFA